jgi:hypothetical protein
MLMSYPFNLQAKIKANPGHVSSRKTHTDENIKAVCAPTITTEYSRKAFDGALCTFHLQGHCKKETCCDFAMRIYQ